jgi:hypothetical protein
MNIHLGFIDPDSHEGFWCALLAVVLYALYVLYILRPKGAKVYGGSIIFSEVSILPDGIYQVVFDSGYRGLFASTMVPVVNLSTTTRFGQTYVVHESDIPKIRNSKKLVEEFIIQNGKVSA